jgi:hypothetical protein
MVDVSGLVFGALFALLGAWAVSRLVTVARTAATVWGASPDGAAPIADGESVTLCGPVFVTEPAPVADRIFGDDTGAVGAYLWRAGFRSAGQYTYDFDRGESRQRRKTFASGIEAGQFGVTVDGRDVYVDPSWLQKSHKSSGLSDLEVGNPKSNASLPVQRTRFVWNAADVRLKETVGECSASRLTDVVDLYRDDVETDEFVIDARGIPARTELFVHGEIRTEDGRFVLTGTEDTPLLLSDQGRDGLKRGLLWQTTKYGAILAVSVGIVALILLG